MEVFSQVRSPSFLKDSGLCKVDEELANRSSQNTFVTFWTVIHVNVRNLQRSEEGVGPMELELQIVLSCHVVLGTEPRSSARSSAFNH